MVRKFKKDLKNLLPRKIEPRFIYKGTKIGSFFRIKDKVVTDHRSDLVYGYTPVGKSSLVDGYVGETNVRLGRREREHAEWDKNSSIYKNSREKEIEVNSEDFVILEAGYPRYIDRKIAEALYIKELNPTLNSQQTSHKLELFN